jgi:hypothetical protein
MSNNKDVTFSTTDELFTALRLPEIRQVLLQACQDSDVRSDALKALLQDRYADLLSTADEASGMLSSVRSLVEKVEELRSASKELISLAEKHEQRQHRGGALLLQNAASSSNNSILKTTMVASEVDSVAEEGSVVLHGSSNSTASTNEKDDEDNNVDGSKISSKRRIRRQLEAWLFSSFASIETFRMQQDYLAASLSVMFSSLASSSSSSFAVEPLASRMLPMLQKEILKDSCKAIASALIASSRNIYSVEHQQLQLVDDTIRGRRNRRFQNDNNGFIENTSSSTSSSSSSRFDSIITSVCSAIYAIAIIRSFSSSSSLLTLSSSSSLSSFTSTVCSHIPHIVEHALLKPAQNRILSDACIGNNNVTSSTTRSSSLNESESLLSNRLSNSTWCFSVVLAVVDALCRNDTLTRKKNDIEEEEEEEKVSLKSTLSSYSLTSALTVIATVNSGLLSKNVIEVENALHILTPKLVWKEQASEILKKNEQKDKTKSSSSSTSSSSLSSSSSTRSNTFKNEVPLVDQAVISSAKDSLLKQSKSWALNIRKILLDQVGPLVAKSHLGISTTDSTVVSQDTVVQSTSSLPTSPSLKYTEALQSVRRIYTNLRDTSSYIVPFLPLFISKDDVLTSTLADAKGSSLSLSSHEYLLGRPLRSLEAFCVRGALHDRVHSVIELLKKSMDVVAECAYAGPLHQYCEEDYYTDCLKNGEGVTQGGVPSPLVNGSKNTVTSVNTPSSLREGLRNASRRFENFGEALRRGENTSKHIEEAIIASSKSAAEGGSRLGVTALMEKKIRHTALPEALCGPSVYTAGIALLVAVGIVTVEDTRSRSFSSSSSPSSSLFVRPTEIAKGHLGVHGFTRLFSKLPTSPSHDNNNNNNSFGLIGLAKDHAAWRKAGAESGWQSPLGACIAASAHYLAAELRAAFVDYADSAAVVEDSDEMTSKNNNTERLGPVGYDERANLVIQAFSTSLLTLIETRFGKITEATEKGKNEQTLSTAYSAIFIGQFAASAHALLPFELLQLQSTSIDVTGNVDKNRKVASSSTNASILSSIASICVESFALNIASHAIEALQYNWALDGALLVHRGGQNSHEISYTSSSYTFSDSAASSAASLEWRSSHGSWMSAHVDSGGGAQVDVPVECSTGLGQALARLSLHVKLLGLLDQLPLFSSSPFQLLSYLTSSSASSSSTSTSSSKGTSQKASSSNLISGAEIVAFLIELGLSPPFNDQYTVDALTAHNSLMLSTLDIDAQGFSQQQQKNFIRQASSSPSSSQQLPEMDESLRSLIASWAGTSASSTSSALTGNNTSSTSSSSSCFIQSSLACRAFRLSCQTAASAVFRELAVNTYKLISTSLSPSSKVGSNTSSVCESAVLQVAYDTYILGHVFQPMSIVPSNDITSESINLQAGLPHIWQNLSKRVFPVPGKKQQVEDPQSLYTLLFNLIDPVERKLIEPRLVSFASSSVKSHALSWARVAPSLAPQTLPGGLQLTSGEGNKSNNGADAWSLSALLGSNTSSSGKGGVNYTSSMTSSSSSSINKTGQVRYGLSVYNSTSAVLLSCPIPASVISAEIEPTAVPLVPVRPPFQRIALLPTPALSRPSTLSSSTAALSLSSSSSSTMSSLTRTSNGTTDSSSLLSGRLIAPHETLVSLLLRNTTPLSSSLTELLSPNTRELGGEGGDEKNADGIGGDSSGLRFEDEDIYGGGAGVGAAAAAEAEAAAAAAAVAAQKRQSGASGVGSGGVVAAAAKGLLQSVFELW